MKRILDFDEIVTQYKYCVEEIAFANQWYQHFLTSSQAFRLSCWLREKRDEEEPRTANNVL